MHPLKRITFSRRTVLAIKISMHKREESIELCST
jgi:hypothetical protein